MKTRPRRDREHRLGRRLRRPAQRVAYAASKAGLLGLTRGLAFDLAADDIRVVFVAPGDIAIPIDAGTPDARPDTDATWVRATPLGRRGTPTDVAGLVSFLCL